MTELGEVGAWYNFRRRLASCALVAGSGYRGRFIEGCWRIMWAMCFSVLSFRCYDVLVGGVGRAMSVLNEVVIGWGGWRWGSVGDRASTFKAFRMEAWMKNVACGKRT